jgi:hypothetical protein
LLVAFRKKIVLVFNEQRNKKCAKSKGEYIHVVRTYLGCRKTGITFQMHATRSDGEVEAHVASLTAQPWKNKLKAHMKIHTMSI